MKNRQQIIENWKSLLGIEEDEMLNLAHLNENPQKV